MLATLRAMPAGIRLFLVYASVILAVLGLSLRYVVDLAIAAPISPIGVVAMVLLAYLIFTITLVLQRKAAARALALGLSSLTLPALAWAAIGGLPVVAAFLGALALLLFRGLGDPRARAFLSED